MTAYISSFSSLEIKWSSAASVRNPFLGGGSLGCMAATHTPKMSEEQERQHAGSACHVTHCAGVK